MMPSWSSSTSDSLDRTVAAFFVTVRVGRFLLDFVLANGCSCSSSVSEDVLSLSGVVCLFLAVGGPTRGRLFFLVAESCGWSSSSNEVGKLQAAVRFRSFRDCVLVGGGTYNCVGRSSLPSMSVVSAGCRLPCCVAALPLGVFFDGDVGLAKRGTFVSRLLGAEVPDVPGVGLSSAVSRRRRLGCCVSLRGVSVVALYSERSHTSSELLLTERLFCRMASMKY